MSEPAAKRPKRSVADEFICPIILQLPVVPVTAEDGHIYERSAIEEYFEGKGDDQDIKSPLTMEVMGKRLLPAPHIKNAIEIMIENETIEGDVGKKWNKRAKEEKEKNDLVKKAEEGDVEAMVRLGREYYDGKRRGFKRDHKLALLWLKKAHMAGSVIATAMCGEILAKGLGGFKMNHSQGTTYLGIAAGKGSDLAAYELGMAFTKGKFGLPVDKEEACRLLELVVSGNCTHKHLNPREIPYARQELEHLKNTDSS